jgi:hypothetical protein
VRALFSSVLASSILLAPVAYGNSLQPRPFGSIPSDHAFILTFASSADTRSSYLVDHKGFSINNFEVAPSSAQTGGFIPNEGTSNFSSPGLSGDVFKPEGVNGGSGTFLGGAGSSLGSSGGMSSSLSLSSGLLWSDGLGKRSDLDGGGRGVGLLAVLSTTEHGDFAPGSEGLRAGSPSVSATPLPGSWTMMLIGLLAFGGLACFQKLKASSTRRAPTVALPTQ